MRKKWIGVITVVFLICMMLTGCGSQETSAASAENSAAVIDTTIEETEEAAEREEAVETLKVAMMGQDVKTACLILAEQLGFFEEEGVNVEFEKVSSLADAVTAVSSGKLDLLPYGVIPSLSFISQGADVVIIGGTISEGSEAIVAAGHSEDFQSIEDFRGKKVGCFRMETGHMVMKGLIREAEMDLEKDVEFIYLDSAASIIEAVLKGEINIGFVNSGYGYIARQSGAEVAFAVGDYMPEFPCCRQTASRTSVTEKHDALVKFEIAELRAYEIYLKDKETTIQILAEYSGQPEDYIEAIMYGTEEYRNAMIVSLDPNKDKVEEFYEVMKENGDIDADTIYDIADYIDTSIYVEALQTAAARETDQEIYAKLLAEYQKNN